MKLSELFDKATENWPKDDMEILKRDIQSQPQNRAAWISTLKGLVAFDSKAKETV